MFARGLTLFLFGLAKKVLIADVLSRPVNSVWAGLAGESGVPTADAWLAVFAYSFQIYFDFSAYSDMALGLGLMMGIVLPVNFLSPYRSASIREFWQRWHMTLSRWLRDYLYIVLGGNRHGRLHSLGRPAWNLDRAGAPAEWTHRCFPEWRHRRHGAKVAVETIAGSYSDISRRYLSLDFLSGGTWRVATDVRCSGFLQRRS